MDDRRACVNRNCSSSFQTRGFGPSHMYVCMCVFIADVSLLSHIFRACVNKGKGMNSVGLASACQLCRPLLSPYTSFGVGGPNSSIEGARVKVNVVLDGSSILISDGLEWTERCFPFAIFPSISIRLFPHLPFEDETAGGGSNERWTIRPSRWGLFNQLSSC
ncbi:hypothetical protein AVEN_221757-1 [Araneus ventricosus]|uniref:Uncharacterized protein n=1 Tax=Araneus ventricosus TaxID=182803 RepID=A0A4Y2FQA2_ARAVE|nr:hypothetical protein AVEN_221757-1 [Araneus ventricosus]